MFIQSVRDLYIKVGPYVRETSTPFIREGAAGLLKSLASEVGFNLNSMLLVS